MSALPTVFITGASRGIGHATAKYFVDQGWRAITCSRDTVPPECARSDRHPHITADLARVDNLDGAIDQLSSCWPTVTSTRWSTMPASRPRPRTVKRLGCLDGDLALWQEVFAINFFAPVFFSRALARRLQQGEGAIVNITSIAGHRVHPFAGSAYSTSKAALWGLTRELAADLADWVFGSTRSAPARSTPRSCRPAPISWSRASRCTASARRPRSPR